MCDLVRTATAAFAQSIRAEPADTRARLEDRANGIVKIAFWDFFFYF